MAIISRLGAFIFIYTLRNRRRSTILQQYWADITYLTHYIPVIYIIIYNVLL